MLRSGARGKASFALTGRGTTLALPALPLATPVTVQLVATEGMCLEAVFAKPSKNSPTAFAAKSD